MYLKKLRNTRLLALRPFLHIYHDYVLFLSKNILTIKPKLP